MGINLDETLCSSCDFNERSYANCFINKWIDYAYQVRKVDYEHQLP